MIANLVSKGRIYFLFKNGKRFKTYYRSGAIKPLPEITKFGLGSVLLTVLPGLLIGAILSKNIANFLEENELFVPSDDDDED